MYSSQIDQPSRPSSRKRQSQESLGPDILERLQEPFALEDISESVEMGNNLDDRVVVRSWLRPSALYDRLDEVVGMNGYSVEFEVFEPRSCSLLCRLTILGVRRTGVSHAEDNLLRACHHALMDAATYFGIGTEEERTYIARRNYGIADRPEDLPLEIRARKQKKS